MTKFFIAILTAAFLSVPAVAQKEKKGVVHDVNITRIIDGDTVAFEAAWLPKPLKPELSIRVYGVDTPEKSWRGQCDDEKALGEKASKFTENAVANAKKTQLYLISWDKYGGRVLGDVLLDGKSLTKMLLEKGYAREYYGDKKASWCD